MTLRRPFFIAFATALFIGAACTPAAPTPASPLSGSDAATVTSNRTPTPATPTETDSDDPPGSATEAPTAPTNISKDDPGMFINRNVLIEENPVQLNYGIAVTDIDNDGSFEAVVAGFGAPNLVLKWDHLNRKFVNIADETLADAGRRAIGVAACDIDGDGREEIYVLNTDTFAGEKEFADRLYDLGGDEWVDLFSLEMNRSVLNLTAGRSVVCVDRFGTGQYGFYVANYGGPTRLYELDDDGFLQDVAPEAGLALITGGRGAVSLPLVSDQMDIFAANERGSNFLFRNLGDGTFRNEAIERGIADPYQNGRGIAVLDANQSGRFDIVYGNWEGPHRIYQQTDKGRFEDAAPLDLATPSRIRTVIAADFDNDGYEELFFNNIGEPNRLFGYREGVWAEIDIGEAAEAFGLGTGGAVGDFDGDGRLELFVSHGESAPQPLSYYVVPENDNGWLRVLPRTEQGGPARGAIVRLTQADGRVQTRAIDAGSGYLCQMEPVAHFGLGRMEAVVSIEVRWPDSTSQIVESPKINQQIELPYPISE